VILEQAYLETEIDHRSIERIKSLLQEEPQRNPYKRFTILAYQLADVGKCLRYMEIYPNEREAYASYFKTAMADTLIQVLILAELYRLSPRELVELGASRLDEFKKKGSYVEEE
jgi:hypothetical protein